MRRELAVVAVVLASSGVGACGTEGGRDAARGGSTVAVTADGAVAAATALLRREVDTTVLHLDSARATRADSGWTVEVPYRIPVLPPAAVVFVHGRSGAARLVLVE